MACLFTTAYLLQTIRAILNEKSAVRWIDDQLNKWVQEASIDISTKTGCYEQTHIFRTSENALEYDEPDGCVKVLGCMKGGYDDQSEWVQHFDDDWQEGDCVYANATWDGSKWIIVLNGGIAQSLDVKTGASWYSGYTPTKIRITWNHVSKISTYFYAWPDWFSDSGYESLDEINLDTSDGDITRLWICDLDGLFHPPQTYNITNIEFYEENILSDTDYRGLSQIHPRLVGHLPISITDEPYHWYHHHSKIGIYPVPDDEYIVTAFYSKVTETITDLPCCMRWLAVPYTLAMARLSEGWKDDFEMFMAMYLNNLMFHRGDICRTSLMAEAKDNFFIPEGR